ncbi:hypothetical protein Tco_1384081 [Tanacetum coccineum]
MTSGMVLELQVVGGDNAIPRDSCLDRKVGYCCNIEIITESEIRNKRGIAMVVRIGFDTNDRDFQGHDQRFTGRNGNDRQGQGNYNQRQHRNQSTRDFNQGHASGEDLSPKEEKQSTITGILYIDDRTAFALYRMAPVELKAFKEQLPGDVGSGFIRPVFHLGVHTTASHGSIKVEAITKCPEPYYVTESVRSFFWGLMAITDVLLRVSPLALPLTQLMRKGEKVCGDGLYERQESFGNCNGDWLSAPILILPSEKWMELLKDYDTNNPVPSGARLRRLPTPLVKNLDQRPLNGKTVSCGYCANVKDGKHTEFSVDDDRDVWFEDRLCVPMIRHFAEKDYKSLGELVFSSVQTFISTPDGQSERPYQTLADMLRACCFGYGQVNVLNEGPEFIEITNEKSGLLLSEKLKEARSRQPELCDTAIDVT